MKRAASAHLLVFTFIAGASGFGSTPEPTSTKPNIFLYLADDVGFNDVGFTQYASPDNPLVHTPTLDKLAHEGIRLDRHYSYRICGPSRASILSGRLAVHVQTDNGGGIGAWNPSDPISGYAGIPRNMTTMASKLKSAGYATHAIGKWDVGMATPTHTPLGRDFDSWLGYWDHAVSYWTKRNGFLSTGNVDSCFNQPLDFFEMNATYKGGVKDRWSLDNTTYKEEVFTKRALEIIHKHDVLKPIFLFFATGLLHTPLQVPAEYIRIVNNAAFQTENERLMAAMANYMDDQVGQLVNAFKAKGMWENTLFVYFSDNGGAAYLPGSGNNWPLQGGKYSDWEGGVRVASFVSGGFVPSTHRHTAFDGVISIADWYATFCVLAGHTRHYCTTDPAAAEANAYIEQSGLDSPKLPEVDSRPMWDYILAGTNGRPDHLQLSAESLLEWPYKVVTGKHPYSFYQGESYPNASTLDMYAAGGGPGFQDSHIWGNNFPFSAPSGLFFRNCDVAPGCLFNVEEDPFEQHNLAGELLLKNKHEEMLIKLQGENTRLFLPNRGNLSKTPCIQAARNGGSTGFYGPFVDVADWYSPSPPVPDFAEVAADYAILNSQLFNDRIRLMTECVAEFYDTPCGEFAYKNTIARYAFDKAPPTPIDDVVSTSDGPGLSLPPLMSLLIALLLLHFREQHPGARANWRGGGGGGGLKPGC